jgi:hypothetical protein
MFRYAGTTCGYDANIPTLIYHMNEKSKSLHPQCDIRGKLSLTKYTFNVFFSDNGGKIKETVIRPRLTDNHKSERLEFCVMCKDKVKCSKDKEGKEFYYCFMDEKWFYIFTSRKKTKNLPPAPGENFDEVFIVARKVRSRRFVTKVMFMGVVAPPHPEHDFDGKIFLKRVSKDEYCKKTSYQQNFSDNYHVNQLLRDGEWMETCYLPDMCPRHLFEAIKDTYDLEDDIVYDLVVSYKTYPTANTNTSKVIRIDRKDKDRVLEGRLIRTKAKGTARQLTLKDLTLHLRLNRGDTYQKDINCDSEFMLSSIREVGKAIRDKFHWVPAWVPIFLFMDNAGGHGTDEAKSEYVEILYTDFYIKVLWQAPQSPETNMLDLGAWMTIQSVVEQLHRHRAMNENALAETVMEAFDTFDGALKLGAIGRRWLTVLDLIEEDDGGNNLIESRRGKLTRPLIGDKLPPADVYSLRG